MNFGGAFKFLGYLGDTQLHMRQTVNEILSHVRPRSKALLRILAHYSDGSLISQFKTHVWELMQSHAGAIFHSSTSILDQIDHSQNYLRP